MYDQQLDYRAIQRRAAAEVQRGKFRARLSLFLVNLFLFLIFFLIGWGTIGGRGLYPEKFFDSMLLLSVGWFTGLLLHGASVWMESATAGKRQRERAVAREIARELARLGLDAHESPRWNEKAKRGARLSDDDGELADFPDHDALYQEELR